MHGESCREVNDPPTLVRFDGTGLKTDGYYCVYSSATYTCNSDYVVLGASGIYRYWEAVTPGSYCSGGPNILDFDGTGLKITSKANLLCS